MRKNEFRLYLENSMQIKSKKAVSSRISRAHTAEAILPISLDAAVTNDDRMYEALMLIHADSREKNGNIQNAVRWYYRFVNGRDFPKLLSHQRSAHTQ